MNIAILQGRLTRDPEIKTTNSGSKITSFTLAIDRGGKSKETDFIDCKAWGKTGEFVSQYFTKGKLITVEGSIQTRTYEAQDGTKRKVTDILVDSVNFVPGSYTEAKPSEDEEELRF